MKFLVPYYSCLQNPWLPPPDPLSLCPLSSTEFAEQNGIYQENVKFVLVANTLSLN